MHSLSCHSQGGLVWHPEPLHAGSWCTHALRVKSAEVDPCSRQHRTPLQHLTTPLSGWGCFYAFLWVMNVSNESHLLPMAMICILRGKLQKSFQHSIILETLVTFNCYMKLSITCQVNIYRFGRLRWPEGRSFKTASGLFSLWWQQHNGKKGNI